MVTIDDVKKSTNMHNIPKSIIVNRHIVLDSKLADALENPDKKYWKYDFDVFLPKYGINLQRPYVWEHYQQNEFILSLLLEKPIDSVVIVEHEFCRSEDVWDKSKAVRYVIDGKQRLMTIQKFLHNEFAVNINGKEGFYNDFDDKLKIFFKSVVRSMTAIVYYSYWDEEVTDDMKIILFNYYNFAGTQQTEEHKSKLQSLLKLC